MKELYQVIVTNEKKGQISFLGRIMLHIMAQLKFLVV